MFKTNKTKLKAYACVLLIMALLITSMIVRPNAANSVSRTLYVGNTLNLTYSNKSVNWSTSNKAIAKISKTSGKQTTVTGVKAGTVTIKAKSNGKVVATCIVVVKNHSLSLNKSSISLSVNGKTSLTATSSASASNIKWSTSDKSIATVSSASGTKTINVVGKKAGTATITVKVGTVKKTCKVTVKKSNTTIDANSIIKKYYKENPQYTKISDGNGTFDEMNGHAAPQQDGMIMQGNMSNTHTYMATGGGKYKYIWHLNGSEFESISWNYPISLSFNNNTFQVGETCGVLRVLNTVPGSTYTWSSSNSNVVGIQVMSPDTSAVRINAKSQGTATITCKVKFRNGETKTLTSKVNVSDSIGSKIPNGTVDMNAVMEKVRTAYIAKDCKWIPDNMSVSETSKMGYTALGSYSAYQIYYSGIEEHTMENIYNPNNKYLNDPESYIVSYSSETFSNVYFMVEYQGHNDNGIQLAQVGVLSIPTVK